MPEELKSTDILPNGAAGFDRHDATKSLIVDDSGYVFVDNARFVSMIAIVMRHCELSLYGLTPAPAVEASIIQFRTFGVQLFFVASGFLMANWLARRQNDVRGYCMTRLRRVAVPWLIWAGLYVVGDALRFFIGPRDPIAGLLEAVLLDIFYQAYWYVPILLFSVAVLLSFRRYWGSRLTGVAFGLLALLYGVNLYTCWFPTSHTIALFAYLFPLWLGVWLFGNFQAVSAWSHRVQLAPLLAIAFLAFCFTLAEDRLMAQIGIPDTYNALQISNQIYAFTVLLILLKLPARLAPSFVDVRKDTYGIYLTHPVVALIGRRAINLVAGRSATGLTLFRRLPELVHGPFARIGLWLVWTVLVYGTSLWITKKVRRSPLAWTVGVRRSPAGHKY